MSMIKVTKVHIFSVRGMDKIEIEFDLPSSFITDPEGTKLDAKFLATARTGLEYVQNHMKPDPSTTFYTYRIDMRSDAPGSKEAIAKGCKCSPADNHNGKGWLGEPGVYTTRLDCPLHGTKPKDKRE